MSTELVDIIDSSKVSNCCGAYVYTDTDICTKCKEHCDIEEINEKPKLPNDKAFNEKLKESGRILNESMQDFLKEINMNEELIKELEQDVKDCEKEVAKVKEEIEYAKKWLDRQKLYLAEVIIRLHKEKCRWCMGWGCN